MSTIIRSVHNTLTTDIITSHTNVVIPASTTVDLFSLISDDELLQLQSELAELVASGSLTVVQSDDSSELKAGGFALPKYTTTQRDATFVKASGSITIVDYTQLSGKVVTVDGVALTEGVEWTAATSNAATATSLASAITTATATDHTTATALGAVVTVTANVAGTAGNAITLAENAGVHISLSGATLSGGIQPASGLFIYNTTTNKLNIFTTTWEVVTSA